VFYQSYAREISEARGWKRLATNSAKLVNILGGYGYRPMLASMEACVDAAVSGNLAPNMNTRVFRARHAMGRTVRGPTLVAKDGFSARYDLDRINGIFSRPSHKLAGQSYVGKILVLDTAKGGRRDRMDAARDEIARDCPTGAGLEFRKPYSRARCRAWRCIDAGRV